MEKVARRLPPEGQSNGRLWDRSKDRLAGPQVPSANTGHPPPTFYLRPSLEVHVSGLDQQQAWTRGVAVLVINLERCFPTAGPDQFSDSSGKKFPGVQSNEVQSLANETDNGLNIL